MQLGVHGERCPLAVVVLLASCCPAVRLSTHTRRPLRIRSLEAELARLEESDGDPR